MESNIIDKQIYEDLISQVDARKLDLASKFWGPFNRKRWKEWWWNYSKTET